MRTSDLPPPDGTFEDCFYISAGAAVGPDEAASREKALQENPNDLASRLILLGYYGRRPSEQEKYFPHLFWMIDNRPGDYVCNSLGNSSGPGSIVWTTSLRLEATSRWTRQLKLSKDANVFCNAAKFFEHDDWATSERLYKRAKKLDDRLALPARVLAYHYRYLASKAAKADRAKLVRLALKEVDQAVQRRDLRGERVGLLTEFTPTAIKFGYLKQARKYAKQLKYYGQVIYIWNQKAYLYLAWLDFRENRRRALKFKLKRLQELFEERPSHVAGCYGALHFVSEVLEAGEKELAQEILTILILGFYSERHQDKKRELEEWLDATKSGRKPKLKILKESMARFF